MQMREARVLKLLFALFLVFQTAPALRAVPAVPAGTCASNEQCGKDELCAKLFGACEESGKCELRPTDCSEHGHMIVKPVCGCDGKSYDSFCLAAAAGVNVRSEGACATSSTD